MFSAPDLYTFAYTVDFFLDFVKKQMVGGKTELYKKFHFGEILFLNVISQKTRPDVIVRWNNLHW